MYYNPEYPVIVAFAGNGGVGKTSTANAIVPRVSLQSINDPDRAVVWDHTFFSAPLYELSSIKQTIQGVNLKDRLLFAIHDVAYPLLRGFCSYDDIVELVYDIWHMDIPDSDSDKPRDFFQKCGDYFRGYYVNCFADQAVRTLYNQWNIVKSDYADADLEAPLFIGIVSDLRMRNEYEVIRRQPNSFVIKLEAPEEVRRQRILERGSRPLSDSQKQHISESEIQTFMDEEFDLIIDTTKFDTVMAQAQFIKDEIMIMLGEEVSA